jgi:methionyl-tRNA formyltransferase
LNLHFSLLPKFRGANPAEWALMLGENKSGIALIRMANKVDAGPVFAFTEIGIEALETRESLYAKLYSLGAETLPEMLKMVDQGEAEANPQPAESPTPYAALFKREDGFLPWQTIIKAMDGKKLTADDFPNMHFLTVLQWLQLEGKLNTRQDFIAFVDRLSRALYVFPGLWTKVMTNKGERRLKILESRLNNQGRLELVTVQLEGQQPARFNQIKNNLIMAQ